jgi:Protein of unknown function (DUF2997)
MTKQVRVQIFPDGNVQADIQGIKGKTCVDYIRILEDILDAKAVDSSYSPEYYEIELVALEQQPEVVISNQQTYAGGQP